MVARARATTMNLEFQNWTYNFRVALDWSLFIAFMGFIAGGPAAGAAALAFFIAFNAFMALTLLRVLAIAKTMIKRDVRNS